MKKNWENEEILEEEYIDKIEDFEEEEIFDDEEDFFEESTVEEQFKPRSSKKYLVMDTISISNQPGPGRLLGYLYPSEVEILEEKEDWVRIEQGWILKRFLRIVE